MEQKECDFSPMKAELKEHLQKLIADMQQSLERLDNESQCLLGRFEQIRREFAYIESTAASYYLNCYLSSFTDKYLDISIGVQHLSQRRHGALIVIQRNDGLDSLITPGIPVGAMLTYSLMESIFFPGSPMHDGAVLIRANQIVSAANVLPLASVFVGEEKLGTRHRAALGLTERSDALVIVVSEETGKASFALNGKLYPLSTGGTM
ncbi:sporulation-specific diadenylate cyclase CdaS [Aneurinibacillus tyrosinisolvens]|uniref:sporulation-specific diadenylate cyclase CdaS n=1 Tax=Aneurinibacillus tyrosinisolvens TaxID=1443435 RepID=UPI00063FC04B|nr:sporulation-specific diadenylate cyclase CdaS [Aneurinibacillus tyrosinisolvens]